MLESGLVPTSIHLARFLNSTRSRSILCLRLNAAQLFKSASVIIPLRARLCGITGGMMYRLSAWKSPALPSCPHLGAAEQECTGVVTYKTPPPPPASSSSFTLSWLSAVMAPVISTISNFIKGGSWLRVSGSRCLGMQTNNCPLMSRPGARKCHSCPTLTRLFCMIRRIAAPLHATSFPIIRHQRPALPPTAARIVCRLKAAEDRNTPPQSPATHPSATVL